MEQFDNLIKEMAEKEEISVPKGFDARVQAVLEELPPKTKKHRPGAIKVALIAVAACLLLVGTALAASPELRGMLAQALGSFAPYAHEQEDQTYTVDGFELKVLSTLTDGSTIRAYVQVKDLEDHRLSADMRPQGMISTADTTDAQLTQIVHATYFDDKYAVYDEETETALLVFNVWGQNFADLSTARLDIWHIYDYDPKAYIYDPEANEGGVPALLCIPLTVEATDKLTFGEGSELAAYLNAKQVELSPLGLTAVFEYDAPVERTKLPTAKELESMLDQPVRVRMKDGTELCRTEHFNQIPSGEAIYSYSAENLYRVIKVWNFPDAIDLKQVESIFVYGEYFPIK